jgi:murein L,D-transpeptidase YafK
MAENRKKSRLLVGIAIVIALAGLLASLRIRSIIDYIQIRARGEKTVSDVIREKERTVKERLKPFMDEAGMSYPLKKISFLAFKHEKILELWGEMEGRQHYIRSYPILAASGNAGPKLREGDRQVPEGIHRIIALNPNGYNYLTMLIDYPNAFDRKNAEAEKRTNLGGDICIHGKVASIGCIAVGDVVIEDLFILVARAGMENVKVIIAPNDLRVSEPIEARQMSISWVPKLYSNIKEELKSYPRATKVSSPTPPQ